MLDDLIGYARIFAVLLRFKSFEPKSSIIIGIARHGVVALCHEDALSPCVIGDAVDIGSTA